MVTLLLPQTADSCLTGVKGWQDTTERKHADSPTVVRLHSDDVFTQINFWAHPARHGLRLADWVRLRIHSFNMENFQFWSGAPQVITQLCRQHPAVLHRTHSQHTDTEHTDSPARKPTRSQNVAAHQQARRRRGMRWTPAVLRAPADLWGLHNLLPHGVPSPLLPHFFHAILTGSSAHMENCFQFTFASNLLDKSKKKSSNGQTKFSPPLQPVCPELPHAPPPPRAPTHTCLPHSPTPTCSAGARAEPGGLSRPRAASCCPGAPWALRPPRRGLPHRDPARPAAAWSCLKSREEVRGQLPRLASHPARRSRCAAAVAASQSGARQTSSRAPLSRPAPRRPPRPAAPVATAPPRRTWRTKRT